MPPSGIQSWPRRSSVAATWHLASRPWRSVVARTSGTVQSSIRDLIDLKTQISVLQNCMQQQPCRKSQQPAMQQQPRGDTNLIPGSARPHTYLVQPAARADSLKELCARSALRISAAAGKEIFGWHCKWMLILLRLRGDSQPEPEFSGFFVHIHTYPVQPKTRADPGIKLVSPGAAHEIDSRSPFAPFPDPAWIISI
jgi:hypothetical protein